MLAVIQRFLEKRSHAKRLNVIRTSYRSGKPLSQLIARDVRREVMIVNIDEIASGFVVAKMRTDNLLYLSKGLSAENQFGNAERIRIDDMWTWTGKPWGGLPDGTSIVDHLRSTTEHHDKIIG